MVKKIFAALLMASLAAGAAAVTEREKLENAAKSGQAAAGASSEADAKQGSGKFTGDAQYRGEIMVDKDGKPTGKIKDLQTGVVMSKDQFIKKFGKDALKDDAADRAKKKYGADRKELKTLSCPTPGPEPTFEMESTGFTASRPQDPGFAPKASPRYFKLVKEFKAESPDMDQGVMDKLELEIGQLEGCAADGKFDVLSKHPCADLSPAQTKLCREQKAKAKSFCTKEGGYLQRIKDRRDAIAYVASYRGWERKSKLYKEFKKYEKAHQAWQAEKSEYERCQNEVR